MTCATSSWKGEFGKLRTIAFLRPVRTGEGVWVVEVPGVHLLSTCSRAQVAAKSSPAHSLHLQPRVRPKGAGPEHKGTWVAPLELSCGGWCTS